MDAPRIKCRDVVWGISRGRVVLVEGEISSFIVFGQFFSPCGFSRPKIFDQNLDYFNFS